MLIGYNATGDPILTGNQTGEKVSYRDTGIDLVEYKCPECKHRWWEYSDADEKPETCPRCGCGIWDRNDASNASLVAECFPDWASIKPGEWSQHGKIIPYGKATNDRVEIGLYREPLDGEDYAGTYTLQIFDGDNVIFCRKVEMRKCNGAT